MPDIDIFCEWNSDLLVTPNGSVQLATGWDHTRQRIVRSLVTNPAQTLPDGSTTAPDYVWHPAYGIGAGSLVGQNPTTAFQADLVSRINQAVLQDVSVDPGAIPVVLFRVPQPGAWDVFISVKLRNGSTGKVAVVLSPDAFLPPTVVSAPFTLDQSILGGIDVLTP